MSDEGRILGWHFLPEDRRLRYGDHRLVVAGETLSVAGVPSPCVWGLHACRLAGDALDYAEAGSIICRVEVWGDVVEVPDKFCGRYRRVLWMTDARVSLQEFGLDEMARTVAVLGLDDGGLLRTAVDEARARLRGEAVEGDLLEVRRAVLEFFRNSSWLLTRRKGAVSDALLLFDRAYSPAASAAALCSLLGAQARNLAGSWETCRYFEELARLRAEQNARLEPVLLGLAPASEES